MESLLTYPQNNLLSPPRGKDYSIIRFTGYKIPVDIYPFPRFRVCERLAKLALGPIRPRVVKSKLGLGRSLS